MSLAASVCALLSQWISFLLVAVPSRSRRTFVELLIGCMLNPEGWVTRAIGAICREAHWTTYYKLIERAHVSVADLSIRLLQLVPWVFPAERVNLIIDDTLVPRWQLEQLREERVPPTIDARGLEPRIGIERRGKEVRRRVLAQLPVPPPLALLHQFSPPTQPPLVHLHRRQVNNAGDGLLRGRNNDRPARGRDRLDSRQIEQLQQVFRIHECSCSG